MKERGCTRAGRPDKTCGNWHIHHVTYCLATRRQTILKWKPNTCCVSASRRMCCLNCAHNSIFMQRRLWDVYLQYICNTSLLLNCTEHLPFCNGHYVTIRSIIMSRSSDNIIKKSVLNVQHFLKHTNHTLGAGPKVSVRIKNRLWPTCYCWNVLLKIICIFNVSFGKGGGGQEKLYPLYTCETIDNYERPHTYNSHYQHLC